MKNKIIIFLMLVIVLLISQAGVAEELEQAMKGLRKKWLDIDK